MYETVRIDWTEERTEALKAQWAAGVSASVIGIGFGISRSAVLGKVNRLGLEHRRASSSGIGEARKPVKRRRNFLMAAADESQARHKPSFGTMGRTRPEPPICEPDPFKRSELSGKAFGEPCGILDLQAASCRWAITDDKPHLFCNAQAVPSLPYCAAHSRIAYNATPKAVRAPSSSRANSYGIGDSRVLSPDWGG